jgi:ERF superfamily protein
MKTSESIVNLAKALLCFQTEVENIKKDASNPFHKSKYASLTNILDGINQHLIRFGIVIMQSPSFQDDPRPYKTLDTDKNGKPKEDEGFFYPIKLITTVIHAESGEFMESEFIVNPSKRDPQGIGSCITYMRRYALASILKLNVDDDDDGNNASNVNGGFKKKAYEPEYVKKKATDQDVDDFILTLSQASGIGSLKDTYISLVKQIKSTYSNADDVINKLEIIKDEIKERFV